MIRRIPSAIPETPIEIAAYVLSLPLILVALGLLAYWVAA